MSDAARGLAWLPLLPPSAPLPHRPVPPPSRAPEPPAPTAHRVRLRNAFGEGLPGRSASTVVAPGRRAEGAGDAVGGEAVTVDTGGDRTGVVGAEVGANVAGEGGGNVSVAGEASRTSRSADSPWQRGVETSSAALLVNKCGSDSRALELKDAVGDVAWLPSSHVSAAWELAVSPDSRRHCSHSKVWPGNRVKVCPLSHTASPKPSTTPPRPVWQRRALPKTDPSASTPPGWAPAPPVSTLSREADRRMTTLPMETDCLKDPTSSSWRGEAIDARPTSLLGVDAPVSRRAACSSPRVWKPRQSSWLQPRLHDCSAAWQRAASPAGRTRTDVAKVAPWACSGNAASEPPVALGGVPPQGDAPSEAAGADCAAPSASREIGAHGNMLGA